MNAEEMTLVNKAW